MFSSMTFRKHCKTLGSGRKPRDRAKAATALGKLGDPRAVEPLLEALSDDGSGFVRENTAEALGRLGDPRAVHPLVAALGDGNSAVRRGAADALLRLGHPKWSQWVSGERGDFNRLGASNDPAAGEPLVAALANIDPVIRK